MSWKNGYPTASGFYWWRPGSMSDSGSRVVEVVIRGFTGAHLVINDKLTPVGKTKLSNGQWAGPLTLPK